MKIIRSIKDWPEAAHHSVMALGNFDGVHKGHQAVIASAKALANASKVPCAVMTFEPHPRRFFKPELPVLRITPFAHKARLLREQGVDYLFVAKFNKAFSQVSAEAFVTDVLRDKLYVSHAVTGHNFAFGKGREGNAEYLSHASEQFGFGFTRVEAVGGEQVYSSTAIRTALADGKVEDASAMLGRNYAMHGRIIHGDQRGSAIGFPTANIRPSPLFMPKFGVYAVRMSLQSEVGSKTYEGVANLGVRPTVDGQTCMLEVHAFDTHDDMYDKRAKVELLTFIRPEQSFDGLEALKSQIAKDCDTARAYFGGRESA